MSQFKFHIRNGFGLAPDEEGQDLPSTENARIEALKGARSLLAAEVETGRMDLRGRIEVTDGQDRPVMTVQFRDAVEIQDGQLPDDPGAYHPLTSV